MKKIFLFMALAINSVCAQTLPNTFKIGDYVELLPGDSLKTWHNCVGALNSEKCASFYRVGKIDSLDGNIIGEFHDYDINRKLLFKATMVNGYLKGIGTFYYPNGTAKETGSYSDDKRTGLWKYYFENGNIAQVLNFTKDNILIVDQYDKEGRKTVDNGNGYYKGEFKPIKTCEAYKISGSVKDGMPDGKWKIYINHLAVIEEYSSGNFVNGRDNIGMYFKNPILKISGFYANENLISYENNPGCPGDHFSIIAFRSEPLASLFYPDLIKKIKNYSTLKNQWLIVGIGFKKDNIDTVNVYSSINDTGLELFIYNYIKTLNAFEPSKTSSEKGSQPLYFIVNINDKFKDDNVLIPAEYVLR